MKPASQGSLFMAFIRIGLLGFGGGPAMIPLVHQEVVKRYGWLEEEEFADVLAIANVLPGPIATKLPGYIGYRVGGVLGCISAVLAVILPMIAGMILLLSIFSRYRDIGWIQGMGQAVVPVVMVMMGQLTWDFWDKSHKTLGLFVSLIIMIVAGVLIYWLGIHPGWIIGSLLMMAWLLPEQTYKNNEATE
ncbi:chromate transporter [Zobellella maritima]|uniref:chromate transporter n=1 Tax=Zobellella maritima TaxID=2059725 RepID=UPI000E3026A2|nr:chromate transporter [Zobellella maritima]